MEKKNEKQGKNKSAFLFPVHKKLGAEKSVTLFFIGERKVERKKNG